MTVHIERIVDEQGAHWASLTVQDRGIGIPASDLPRIFERYRRGRNVGQVAGTGLGLTGAKQIVERHGGAIAVASEEGRGTRVTIRLPLEPRRRSPSTAAGLNTADVQDARRRGPMLLASVRERTLATAGRPGTSSAHWRANEPGNAPIGRFSHGATLIEADFEERGRMDRGRIASLLFRCLDRLTTAKLRVGMLRQGLRSSDEPGCGGSAIGGDRGEIDQAARLIEDARLEVLPSP